MITLSLLFLAAVIYGAGLPIALAAAIVLTSLQANPTRVFLGALFWPVTLTYYAVRAIL